MKVCQEAWKACIKNCRYDIILDYRVYKEKIVLNLKVQSDFFLALSERVISRIGFCDVSDS